MAVQPVQQFSLDRSTEAGFVRFYSSMPEKPATTIRIFERNDYYTAHGDDAFLAAKEIFHTNSVVKYIGFDEKKIASVVLSKAHFEALVRFVLVQHYRVEVYSSKTKGGNEWVISCKASPGNLHEFEDLVYGGTEVLSTCIIAIRLATEGKERVLGVAYVDQGMKRLGMCEFIENDQFSNLEALLVQLSPKESLIIANDPNTDAGKLRQVLQRSSICITERKKSEFAVVDVAQDLNRLLRNGKCPALSLTDVDRAISCLSALFRYLELLSNEENFGQFQLDSLDFTQFMRLDAAAAHALNLEYHQGENKTMSLTGLLNRCKTKQGQRLLFQWVKQPLLDKEKIDERLNVVEVFVLDTQLRQALQEECLQYMPDFMYMSKKLLGGKATLQDCVRIYQALQRVPAMLRSIIDYNGNHAALLNTLFVCPLKELNEDFEKYLQLIEETVDLEQVDQNEYMIKPSFDDNLLKLRSQMSEMEAEINAQFTKAANELKLEPHKTIKLESNNQQGYFLRITKKAEKCIRSQQSKFTILETRQDGVKFTFPSLRVLNDKYTHLKEEYSSTQCSLVDEVLKVAAGYAEPLLSLNDIIACLDTFVSFAHVSACAPVAYVRPTIMKKGEGNIILKSSRHPCLEMQDTVAFIANDVTLMRDKDMFQIITGPNMGGKSTYIRQIAVTVLMAQIGCFVPCSEATISVVDRILCRVGASDSQVKGVSTFMAEMLETASILRTATKDSLIIIDELGRGTSTYDGFGLAWAISEHIATQIEAFCLFATHFYELTALADVVPTVSNLHVTALTANDTLTLLYRVKRGACDQSFGIHIAELAQFPGKVIELARRKASELEFFHCPGRDSLGPLSKRKLEIEKGEELIEEFLLHAKRLCDMDDDGASVELKHLKQVVLNSGNTYIQALISS